MAIPAGIVYFPILISSSQSLPVLEKKEHNIINKPVYDIVEKMNSTKNLELINIFVIKCRTVDTLQVKKSSM